MLGDAIASKKKFENVPTIALWGVGWGASAIVCFSLAMFICVCVVLLCNILRGEGKVCHSERPLSPLERMGQALGRHKAHQAHACFQKHPPRASIQASSWAQGRQATSRPMCVLVLSLRERRAAPENCINQTLAEIHSRARYSLSGSPTHLLLEDLKSCGDSV